MSRSSVLGHAEQSAKTLTIAGMALQAVQVGLWFLLGLYFSSALFQRDLYLVLGGVGILWLVLVFLFSYRRMASGEFVAARTPTLVFAVLSVLSVGILAGLFYVLAYHELGNPEVGRASSSPMRPPTPLVSGSKVCPICAKANPLSTSFCQGCGFVLA